MLKKYPKLYDAALFEVLVRDVMECRLGVTFQLYGRKGQLQQGIDLFSSGEAFIVVQCKDYLSEKSEAEIVSIITKEMEKSKQLNITISEFWFATALNRDVKIQNAVNAMQMSIPIRILFWEDIEEVLSYNIDIERKYYPQYFCASKNYSALLALGFFSQVFAQYVNMMSDDRRVSVNYCRMIQNGLDWVQDPGTKEEVSIYLETIIKYLQGSLGLAFEAYHWCLDVQNMCLDVQNMIETIQFNLRKEECEIFILGKNLGRIDYQLNFTEAEQVSESLLNEVMCSLEKMFVSDSQFLVKTKENLSRVLKKEKELSDYDVAGRLFYKLCEKI